MFTYDITSPKESDPGLVGLRGSGDYFLPTLWDGLPGGLIRCLQRHVDIHPRIKKHGHIE